MLKDVSAWRNHLQLLIMNGEFTITESEMRLKGVRIPEDGNVLDRETGLAYILKMLWHCIAKPILDVLPKTVRFMFNFQLFLDTCFVEICFEC